MPAEQITPPDSVPNSKSEAPDKSETATRKKNKIDVGEARSSQTTSASPLWVLIVGVIFLILAVLFFIGLVGASLAGITVPDNSRYLVFIVLALTASVGSGFLGGSAVASGQIKLPKLLDTPVRFGVTGGICVFIITLILCPALFSPPPQPPPQPPPVRAPTITNVDTNANVDIETIDITFEPESLPPRYKLYAEVATDSEFKQLARPRFPIADSTAGVVLISLPRSKILNFWLRFVVETPEGQVAAKSDPWPFKISS